MTQSASQIQTDFDRIALLSRDGWDHNSHYHDFLLRQIPPHLQSALDIGCGTGEFSRLLAERCDQVLAIDLSPQMIRLARERSSQHSNIEFEIADVMTRPFAPEQFDCIASIATLHHLPLDEILLKMKRALKPNGTLLVLDLFQERGLYDPSNLLAVPASIAFLLVKTGHFRQSTEARAAWDEHGKHDSYLTLPQIKNICADVCQAREFASACSGVIRLCGTSRTNLVVSEANPLKHVQHGENYAIRYHDDAIGRVDSKRSRVRVTAKRDGTNQSIRFFVARPPIGVTRIQSD